MRLLSSFRLPEALSWMILFTLLVLSMGSGDARAQGIPCDDYGAGGVVPFERWEFRPDCTRGGTDRYRIFSSHYSDDDRIFVGKTIYDAADPAHPVEVFSYGESNGGGYWIPWSTLEHLAGDRFVLFHSSGLTPAVCHVLEIGAGGVGGISLSYTSDLEGNQRYLWHQFENGALKLLDAADLNSIVELDPQPGMVMPSLVLEDLGLQHENGVWTVIDLTDPAGPVLRGTFLVPEQDIVASELVDHVLYFALPRSLWLLGLDSLDHPAILASINTDSYINSLEVQDGLLHVCTESGLLTYEVADPAAPELLADDYSPGGTCIQVVARGDLLYARFTMSLCVYDIADPSAPLLLGVVDLGGTELITCYRLDLVAADRWLVSGEHFFHFDCNDPLPLEDDEQAPAPPAASPLSVSASQALQRAPEIRFSLDRPGEVDLSVYDLQGRRLSTLVSAALPSGPHAAIWNARDAAGRTQPAGVYLARLRIDDRTATCKLTLIK